MSIGPYSPCPGGLDKKIKFCCSQFVPDFQAIERMLEDRQFENCLHRIDRLLVKSPTAACLLTYRARVLSALGRSDEAVQAAEALTQNHPDRMHTHVNSAMTFIRNDDPQRAILSLHAAMERMTSEISAEDARSIIGACFVLHRMGLAFPAAHLLRLILSRLPEEATGRALESFYKDCPCPLAFKALFEVFPDAPADVPWEAQYLQAINQAESGKCQAALIELSQLPASAQSCPAVLKSTAILQAALAIDSAAIETLQKLEAAVPTLDEKIAANMFARLLGDEVPNDQASTIIGSYEVDNLDAELETILSRTDIRVQPIDRRSVPAGSPVPAAAAILLDGPVPREAPAEGAPPLEVRTCGRLVAYGKRTNAPAVIQLYIEHIQGLTPSLDEWRQRLGLTMEPSTEPVVRPADAVRMRMSQIPVGLPQNSKVLKSQWIADQTAKTILEWAPQLPYSQFGGLSLMQVAKQPQKPTELWSMVWEFEEILDAYGRDHSQVRQTLGLPGVAAVDMAAIDRADPPLLQLMRMPLDDLDTEDLKYCFRLASFLNEAGWSARIAKALLPRRESLNEMDQAQLCLVLAMSNSGEESIQYLQMARDIAVQLKQPTLSIDLSMIQAYFDCEKIEEGIQKLGAVFHAHKNSPDAVEMIAEFCVEHGMVNAEGQPVIPVVKKQESPLFVPDAAAAEGGGLWTPEGAAASGSGERPKLWIPGMD